MKPEVKILEVNCSDKILKMELYITPYSEKNIRSWINLPLNKFLWHLFDYSGNIEFYHYINGPASGCVFTFKDFNTYSVAHSNHNELPTDTQQAIDMLIAFEFFIRLHEIDFSLFVHENDNVNHHPDLKINDFFKQFEEKSSPSQRLANAILTNSSPEYEAVRKVIKENLEYKNKFSNTPFIQLLIKTQQYRLMGLSAQEFPEPTRSIDNRQLVNINSQELLTRFNRLAKLSVLHECFGKIAPDGGQYHIYYTEIKFLLSADFQLHEDGKISIIPNPDKTEYGNVYAEGKRNHAIFEGEMRAIVDSLSLEIDNSTSSFHERIIFDKISSKKLIDAGVTFNGLSSSVKECIVSTDKEPLIQNQIKREKQNTNNFFQNYGKSGENDEEYSFIGYRPK